MPGAIESPIAAAVPALRNDLLEISFVISYVVSVADSDECKFN